LVEVETKKKAASAMRAASEARDLACDHRRGDPSEVGAQIATAARSVPAGQLAPARRE
jgi:hypothetical protein